MDKNYLRMLQKEMHTTVLATVDENNRPVTAVIDMMAEDGKHLYFLTAKGKGLYKRLINNPYVSISSWIGETSITSKAITVRAKAVEIGSEMLTLLFKENDYMYSIYKTEESRNALTVFRLDEIKGEFFDLSSTPIYRESFGETDKTVRYTITNDCKGCKKCLPVCPQQIISIIDGKAAIKEENCLHCGECYSVCPFGAVKKIFS